MYVFTHTLPQIYNTSLNKFLAYLIKQRLGKIRLHSLTLCPSRVIHNASITTFFFFFFFFLKNDFSLTSKYASVSSVSSSLEPNLFP